MCQRWWKYIIGLIIGLVLIAISLSVGLSLGLRRRDTKIEYIECDVAILGAGFSGSFAAYQLANRSGNRLCLIEKLERFGGRVYDISSSPNGSVFGVGALRVNSNQLTMIALAKQLNIEFQEEDVDTELRRVRGKYYYYDIKTNNNEINKMCEEVFPSVTCNYSDFPNRTNQAILSKLIKLYDANNSIAYEYPDFPQYISSLFGDESLAFIRVAARHHGPYSSVSIHSILEYLKYSSATASVPVHRLYPIGGMSQFIIKMLDHVFKSNAKIYTNEAVLKIDHDQSIDEGNFRIQTTKHEFRAKSVLCAIDPIHLANVGGNVVETIKMAPEYKVISPNRAAIVTIWWNERWWEKSTLFRNLSRALSYQSCFSVMEIPQFKYGRDQNVTRAVYDDGSCLDMWRILINSNNKQLLTKTVNDSLSNFFHDVQIPSPKFVHGFFHESAWHFQVANSTIKNQQLFEWSHQPIPGKNISLIGEGYNIKLAAWCDGALKSTMWVLKKKFWL